MGKKPVPDDRAAIALAPPTMADMPREAISETFASLAVATRQLQVERPSLRKILAEVEEAATELARHDESKAVYTFPFGGKVVHGIATGMAEMVAMVWRNNFHGTVVQSETEECWYINGVFVDVQTGTVKTRIHVGRKCPPGGSYQGEYWVSDHKNKRGEHTRIERDRALSNAFGTAVSKATRKVIEHALPLPCAAALRAADKTIAKGKDGRAKDRMGAGEVRPGSAEWTELKRRAKAIGVTREMIREFLDKSQADATWEDYEAVKAQLGSIEAEELEAKEAFLPAARKEDGAELPF